MPTKRESPAHRRDLLLHALEGKQVSDLKLVTRGYVSFTLASKAVDVVKQIADSDWQLVFPVVDGHREIAGVITADVLRAFSRERALDDLVIAADLMSAPLVVDECAHIHHAIELMLTHHARQLLVTNEHGAIVAFLDESDVTRAHLSELIRTDPPP